MSKKNAEKAHQSSKSNIREDEQKEEGGRTMAPPPFQLFASPVESPPPSTPPSNPNETGMPDQLKAGVEQLSGHNMSDVRVHYNSDKPAQLQAHAYAQGSEIHIAAGQEKHLPHEAWHVAQQKQGRVQPTMQLKGKVNVNDDLGLEAEADVLGAKAMQLKLCAQTAPLQSQAATTLPVQLKKLVQGRLNVVGESHPESDKRRNSEKHISGFHTGGGYWTESEFRKGDKLKWGDSPELRVEQKAEAMADMAKAWFDEVADFDNLDPYFKGKMIEALRVALCIGESIPRENEHVINKSDKNNALVTNSKALTTILKAMMSNKKGKEASLNFSKAVEAVLSLLEGRTRDVICKERTVHMENAAAFEAKTPGVWKVGQKHIDEWGPKTGPYETLTQDEFNNEYKSQFYNY